MFLPDLFPAFGFRLLPELANYSLLTASQPLRQLASKLPPSGSKSLLIAPGPTVVFGHLRRFVC